MFDLREFFHDVYLPYSFLLLSLPVPVFLFSRTSGSGLFCFRKKTCFLPRSARSESFCSQDRGNDED